MTQPSPEAMPRRGFLQWLVYGAGALAAAIVSLPIIGYLVGAMRRSPTLWVPLGTLDQFPREQTRLHTFENPIRQPWDGMAAHIGVYVRYLGLSAEQKHQFLVFAMNCTHLGCPVTWFPQSGLFMCPCHGGVYYENGAHASGPPPRGLYHCEWRVVDGKLEVQAPHLPTLQNTLDKPARV